MDSDVAPVRLVGQALSMGQRTTHPTDARWTAPAIDLLRAAVLLDLSYETARRWAAGATKTAMGATVVVASPLVPAVQSHGRDIDLPLMGLAGVVLLQALTVAGADPTELAKVVRALQDQEGPFPLAAHRDVAVTLPLALAAAASDRAEPSLLAPIVPARDGWRFGPVTMAAFAFVDHDADGWVNEVQLAGGAVIVRSGHATAPPVDGVEAGRAANSMFRAGYSLVAIAAVFDCAVDDIEAALRLKG